MLPICSLLRGHKRYCATFWENWVLCQNTGSSHLMSVEVAAFQKEWPPAGNQLITWTGEEWSPAESGMEACRRTVWALGIQRNSMQCPVQVHIRIPRVCARRVQCGCQKLKFMCQKPGDSVQSESKERQELLQRKQKSILGFFFFLSNFYAFYFLVFPGWTGLTLQ